MTTPFKAGTILGPLLAMLTGMQFACQKYTDYESPQMDCSGFGFKEVTLSEIKQHYTGQTVLLSDSLQWNAVVVSSDATSNLFGEIYLQEDAANSAGGLVFYTDLLETHARVPSGTRISVKLKGLYLGASSGSFQLGGAFPTFGNLTVGRLPSRLFSEHIRVRCDQTGGLDPLPIGISDLTDSLLNTLIEVKGVEFIAEELGLPFADPGTQVRRTLSDCYGNVLRVRNSGYSDFYSEPLPSSHGDVKGILSVHRKAYELLVMNPSDFDFGEPRCENLAEQTPTDSIIISEIADPDNLPRARFLELFNASGTPVDLRGWELLRYTNANAEPGRPILLEGLQIQAHSAVVLSAYPEDFERTYGFSPDKVIAENGPADSNGDDNIVLIDPYGNVKDTFGNPGKDGSGTAHEFEDGKAERQAWVQISSPVYDPLQWVIYNDSGGETTFNEPQQAPEDFTPGRHPYPGKG